MGHRFAAARQNPCEGNARFDWHLIRTWSCDSCHQDVEASSWLDIRRFVKYIYIYIYFISFHFHFTCLYRHIHLNETHAGAGSIFTQLKVRRMDAVAIDVALLEAVLSLLVCRLFCRRSMLLATAAQFSSSFPRRSHS
jgi:hypothetical protein